MASRRTNRFVDTAAPALGTSQGKDLQAIEKRYTLNQAVDLFRKERNGLKKLQEACNEAEALLLSKRKDGQDLGNLASLDNDSQVAIVAFTLDDPNVCEDFNYQSRRLTSLSWNGFPYKGMWLLLNKAILSHGKQQTSHTFYRGITELEDASSTYCFRQVASTSLNQDVAKEFENGQGTMYIVKGPRCLGIKNLSKFPDEDEYILPAFDTFTAKVENPSVTAKVENPSVTAKVENPSDCRKIYLQA